LHAPTATCGRYFGFFGGIDHGLTPQNSRKIVNRKAFEIMGLLKHSYASAFSPTATYSTENDRTPYWACTDGIQTGLEFF
jgi:hypothetical protein